VISVSRLFALPIRCAASALEWPAIRRACSPPEGHYRFEDVVDQALPPDLRSRRACCLEAIARRDTVPEMPHFDSRNPSCSRPRMAQPECKSCLKVKQVAANIGLRDAEPRAAPMPRV